MTQGRDGGILKIKTEGLKVFIGLGESLVVEKFILVFCKGSF